MRMNGILRGWLRESSKHSRTPSLARLVLIAAPALAAAVVLSACENVAKTTTQPSLVRVIDASYAASALNVVVEGEPLGVNLGLGTITSYGTVAADVAAPIGITAATGGATILTSSGALLTGHQYSVFLTGNGVAPYGYVVSLLADQQIAAAQGHSAFRFLNQAAKTGAVDIYMVPTGATLATSVPIVTNLPVGGTDAYISIPSQAVTLEVTPTGVTTPAYSLSTLTLTGGEVRTVLIVDNQLTSNPAVAVTIASDAGPAN